MGHPTRHQLTDESSALEIILGFEYTKELWIMYFIIVFESERLLTNDKIFSFMSQIKFQIKYSITMVIYPDFKSMSGFVLFNFDLAELIVV